MLVFHPDIPSGISGPWVEIYSLGDINLSPKREHLEALLDPPLCSGYTDSLALSETQMSIVLQSVCTYWSP